MRKNKKNKIKIVAESLERAYDESRNTSFLKKLLVADNSKDINSEKLLTTIEKIIRKHENSDEQKDYQKNCISIYCQKFREDLKKRGKQSPEDEPLLERDVNSYSSLYTEFRDAYAYSNYRKFLKLFSISTNKANHQSWINMRKKLIDEIISLHTNPGRKATDWPQERIYHFCETWKSQSYDMLNQYEEINLLLAMQLDKYKAENLSWDTDASGAKNQTYNALSAWNRNTQPTSDPSEKLITLIALIKGHINFIESNKNSTASKASLNRKLKFCLSGIPAKLVDETPAKEIVHQNQASRQILTVL